MSDLLEQIKAEFDPKFDELTSKAADLGEQLETASKEGDSDTVKSLTNEVSSLDEKVKDLTRERDEQLKDAQIKSMAGRVEELTEMLRNPANTEFDFGTLRAPDGEAQKALWQYDERGFGRGEHPSFFEDVHKALIDHDREALERWAEHMPGKAMTEGTGSAGGYLVPDQIANELLEYRQEVANLRPLFSNLQVSSDTLRIPSITSGLTAGWVAELANKPAADLTFAELSVNTFTKAGLAVASNQLIRDSRVSLDRLVYREIAKKLAWLEELAYIAGTGTGQPRGILNTTGVDTLALTDTAVLALLDRVVDAVSDIYTDFFEGPDAVVMHPRTWARIIKARESSTSATYIVGAPGQSADGRSPTQPIPGYGPGQTPRGSLFGYPVYTTSAVPTNIGTGEDESVVIVGKFDEGLVLDHQGISFAASEHVYFTSNQTVFRGEDQVGFTAARYPQAFKVISGVGLAGG